MHKAGGITEGDLVCLALRNKGGREGGRECSHVNGHVCVHYVHVHGELQV